MKAQELRALVAEAHKNLQEKDQQQFDNLMKQAELAARRGQTRIDCSGTLSDVLKKRIESEGIGVKVEYNYQDGSYIILTW